MMHPVADFAIQPITTTGERVLCGHEFLVRLQSDQAYQCVDRVFESAVKYGVLQDVDRYLCHVALDLLDEPCHGAGYINLSAKTLFDESVGGRLVEARAAGSRVVIELSERAPIEDWTALAARIEALQSSGIGFALDDFGSGAANVMALSRVRFDEVKFDPGLIEAGQRNARAREIIERAVGLCHEAGARVIATGVDAAAAQGFVTDLGFDAMQGLEVGPPVSVEAARVIAYDYEKGILSNLCRR